MQYLQEIEEKIFFESKNILEALSKINSKEELLSRQDLFSELTDRISFLKILEKNKDSFESILQPLHNESTNEFERSQFISDEDIDSALNEDVTEEEVVFTNEINDFDPADEEVIYTGNLNDMEEEGNNDFVANENDFETKVLPISQYGDDATGEIELQVEQNDPDYAERVSQKEKDFLESEERRRKIVDFGKEEKLPTDTTESVQELKPSEQLAERKFKLANIKGLKAVQNLFDDDPLEQVTEIKPVISENESETGSLLKTNIPTDFMEATKKQPEFRLDFNDNVAFTNLLFNGNNNELKATIEKLNSYENIEDARQYLSEIYYKKDWQKNDEYAQRLWDLVESKF